jgi:hypothetical protein
MIQLKEVEELIQENKRLQAKHKTSIGELQIELESLENLRKQILKTI